MKTRKLIGLLFILPLLAACTGNKQSDETAQTETFTKDTIPTGPNIFYFNGDFTYYADAATLKDCISGAILPVAMKGEYLKVEKKYQEMKPRETEAINCGVMGYLIPKETDEEGPDMQLLITGLVGFDRTVSCNPENIITDAVYATYHPDEKESQTKTSITFDNDYTFQCTTYQLSPVKLVSDYKGHWFRTAKDNIVLLVNGEVLYEGTIDYSNMNLILQNDDEKEVVFKKKA